MSQVLIQDKSLLLRQGIRPRRQRPGQRRRGGRRRRRPDWVRPGRQRALARVRALGGAGAAIPRSGGEVQWCVKFN